ncbi:MAG: adenylate kinase [Candidatus Omnitrophica bacterium]|nr:adenylate kinase [Candidatus Omnitrophota bacterium]
MRLVLLGPPGAGKGTQAEVLSRSRNIPAISTGDILRERIRDGSEIGREAKKYVESGSLVPDAVVIKMVRERLACDDARRGFILDGFPRTVAQAEALDKVLRELRITLDAVLYFETSTAVIVERLTGRRVCPKCRRNYHIRNIPPKKDNICDDCSSELIQRKDDTEETIRRRLRVYEEETAPLVKYYDEKGSLKRVSGDLDVKKLNSVIEKMFKG